MFEDYTETQWTSEMKLKFDNAKYIAITKYEDYDELNIIKLYQAIVGNAKTLIPANTNTFNQTLSNRRLQTQKDDTFNILIFKESIEYILNTKIISFTQLYKSNDDTSHDTSSVLIIKTYIINGQLYLDAKYDPTKNSFGWKIPVDMNIPIKIWKKGNELTKWRASRFDL